MKKHRYYYWGQVESDGSPVIINRDLFLHHAHILGNSGTGKSAMRLSPLVEQTIGFGDTSLIFIDLKGDKLENLAACYAAQAELKSRTGAEIPIRVLTLEQGMPSHVFNPFLTTGFKKLSLSDRVSLITEPLGLFHGITYGPGHYSAMNAATVRECLTANPSASSLHELYSGLMEQASDAESYVGSLRPNEYIQVAETILSLAECNVLNVTPKTSDSKEALECQIDLASAFQTPAIYYFHLTSVVSPFVAQMVGRLVLKYLLIAAKTAPRNTRVQVVIDEFQRMIADNLDIVFQQARGLDISLVLANQSLGDLRNAGPVLLSAIEGNCNIRQWLSTTTLEDIEHLKGLFGCYKEEHVTVTESENSSSVSTTLRDEPRITTTDLHQISSDPFLSVTQIRGEREGFANYSGVPFVMRNNFHIDERGYNERLKLQWPTDLPGMMTVCDLPVAPRTIKPVHKKRLKRSQAPASTTPAEHDKKLYEDLFV